MKKLFLLIGVLISLNSYSQSTVYFTSEITPESLVKIFHALDVKPIGRVAVKISTGESAQSNHLRPEFIKDLVEEVDGTLVECNTAYWGSRNTTQAHRRAISERGYDKIAAGEDTMGVENISDGKRSLYNVFTLDGKKVLDKAISLESLDPGIYIINGKKQVVN